MTHQIGVIPGAPQVKQIVQAGTQPKLVEKSTGELYMLVRDDVSENGKLYVAPLGMMTSMHSIKPEQFFERFEWYVEPGDRPIPEISKPHKKGGRPAGSKDKKPRARRKKAKPT